MRENQNKKKKYEHIGIYMFSENEKLGYIAGMLTHLANEVAETNEILRDVFKDKVGEKYLEENLELNDEEYY